MSKMKEIDLFSAFTDVDDRFVLEVMEADEQAPRRPILRRAAAAAAAVILIAVVGVAANGLLKKETPAGESGTPAKKGESVEPAKEKTSVTKRWADAPNYEKYSELLYGGARYFGSPGICEEAVGKHLGKLTVIGLDYGERTVGEKTAGSDGKTSGDGRNEEITEGAWIAVENRDVPAEVQRETEVDVYEITDVDTSFAVAVKFPDEDRYWVYGNDLFGAKTYAEFAEGTQLLRYTDLRAIVLHEQGGERRTEDGSKTIPLLLEELFAAEAVPAFFTEELPGDFGGVAYLPDDPMPQSVWTAPNPGTGTTRLIVSEEVSEFLQDKELGECCVELGVDYRLLGQQNVVIKVYSGGFVTTNIGWSGRTFYVGPERVESFVRKMR